MFKIEKVEKRNFYGYYKNPGIFLKIFVYSPKYIPELMNILNNGVINNSFTTIIVSSIINNGEINNNASKNFLLTDLTSSFQPAYFQLMNSFKNRFFYCLTHFVQYYKS